MPSAFSELSRGNNTSGGLHKNSAGRGVSKCSLVVDYRSMWQSWSARYGLTEREREGERERAAPQQTCVKADKRTTEISVLLLQNKGSTLNERHLQALCEGFYTSPRFDFS